MGRTKAVMVSSAIAFVGGMLCALSFGPLSDVTIFGMTFFSFFDYFSSNICLPVGGMIISIFAGWFIKKRMLREQLTDHGKYRFRMIGVLAFCLRYLCPAAILLIFLNSIGIIR